jgi:hypothetical protein
MPQLSRSEARLAALALGPWLAFYLVHIQAVQPWGSRWIFEVGSVVMLLTPLSVVVPAFLAGRSLVKRSLRDAVLAVTFFGLQFGLLRAFHPVSWFFRANAVRRSVASLAVVPPAVRAFAQREGRPPASLQELVPRDLAAVPATGFGAYSEIEVWPEGRVPEGDTWGLAIPMSQGILNWDLLLYFPSGRYPPIGYGGRLERFGEWAYVHE